MLLENGEDIQFETFRVQLATPFVLESSDSFEIKTEE